MRRSRGPAAGEDRWAGRAGPAAFWWTIWWRAACPRERIELRGHTPHVEHLAAHGDIDIMLDSFPHGGGVTSIEALMMGVPVSRCWESGWPAGWPAPS